MRERTIQAQILQALGSRDDVRIWRHGTGVGRALHNDQVLSWGLKGSSDLVGIVSVRGRGYFLAVEVKSAQGRLTPEQSLFGAMVQQLGGCYVIARSREEAVAAVESFIARQQLAG